MTNPAVPNPSEAFAQPIVTGFTLGPFQTNCYVVSATDSDECWIVDASFEPDDLIKHVRASKLRPTALILTHAHVDHIAGIADVVRAFPGLPVWGHEAEREWLGNPGLNLSIALGDPVALPGPNRFLRHGEELRVGGTRWRVAHTPGHSPGSISLIHLGASHVTVSGDVLFAGSIGRTDFPGCSFEELASSIRTKLYALPDDTVVWPGHGPKTTIGREKRSNPFVPA